MGAQAAKTPEHVGDVAAEDASEDVQLVDHDVAQAAEERGPAGVVGQQPGVDHVGVGEHHVGVAPCPRALRRRGVPVVAAGHHTGQVEGPQRSQLVVGQGLGRCQAQGGGGRAETAEGIAGGFGDGNLVAQRLARCRARGHHHRLAGASEIDCSGLMTPQSPRETSFQRRSEGSGEFGEACAASGKALEVHEGRVVLEPGDEPVELHLHGANFRGGACGARVRDGGREEPLEPVA